MKVNAITTVNSRYQFVPRTLVFIKNNDKYLLIHKKKRNSFGFNKFNGVGGHLEKGEEPFESACREIAEETGLIINRLELTAILFIDTISAPGIQVFVFRADYLNGEITNSCEGILKWMTYAEIKDNKDVVSDVPELIQICESHSRGSKPQIIKYLNND